MTAVLGTSGFTAAPPEPLGPDVDVRRADDAVSVTLTTAGAYVPNCRP